MLVTFIVIMDIDLLQDVKLKINSTISVQNKDYSMKK